MGSLRPLWGSPNLEGLLVAFAVVIVKLLSNMSLRSFRIAGAKVVKKIENATRFVQKILKGGQFRIILVENVLGLHIIC